MSLFSTAKTPQQETYTLKCKVVVKEVAYEDEQSKGNFADTAKMVFLVPQEGTQTNLFLSAWLPDTVTEHHEVGLMISHPINGPCRAAVMRHNARMDAHHLFVMSVGAGEDLIQEFGGEKKKWTWFKDRVITVEVLPETEDRAMDMMKDPLSNAGLLKKYGKA